MPINETDQAFIHIQVIDETHCDYILYARKEVEPFDFEIKMITHCIRVNNQWEVDNVEYF